ncbi:MAG: histidine phosphatase family protein [unclassified Hahellaceae]|nr:histidine phosphatase family protein [Hahellaceae bacterium]|tara:strand:- start:16677 stop:17477 length:801 start_codon:yes stop_codon:yes gene_type:complete
MASIYLIRHGQASFHSSNYDQLSELGQRQAGYAGEQLARELGPGRDPADVSWFCGTLSRQIDTEQRVRAGCFPDMPKQRLSEQAAPVTNAGFNEFDHEALLAHYLQRLRHKPEVEAFLNAVDDRTRLFQPAFNRVVDAWIADGDFVEDAAEAFETWAQFKQRIVNAFESAVTAGWEQARESGKKGSGDVCIVSSGGPISLMLQAMLNMDDVSALDANWVLANASITKLIYRSNPERPPQPNELRLAYFNHYHYLQTTAEGDAVSFR